MQQQIDYADIMSLGFKEEFIEDTVFFNEIGFQATIIQKQLTPNVYIDWAKDTRLAEMLRIDSTKNQSIMARMPIRDLEHLRDIVQFFTVDENKTGAVFNEAVNTLEQPIQHHRV